MNILIIFTISSKTNILLLHNIHIKVRNQLKLITIKKTNNNINYYNQIYHKKKKQSTSMDPTKENTEISQEKDPQIQQQNSPNSSQSKTSKEQ